MLKRLLSIVLTGLVLVSATPVFAMTAPGSTRDLLKNMTEVKSADVEVSVNVETKNDSLAQPEKFGAEISGVSNLSDDGRFDFMFTGTDQTGKTQTVNAAGIITGNALYLTKDGKDWYFNDRVSTKAVATDSANVDQSINDANKSLQELFDRGVISYRVEGFDVINRKPALRYAYSLDNDKLVDYLVFKQAITSEQALDLRTTLTKSLTVNGNFWVDTAAMMPAMFTVNVSVRPNETCYTNVSATVHFNSFNQNPAIEAPKNAINIKDYKKTTADKAIITNLEKSVATLDTDGDGLSDADETNIWHTNILSADSDRDGHSDKIEVTNGYNPNGAGKLDSDNDGLSDYLELTKYHTNRYSRDTDRDGFSDYTEVMHGYNPNGSGRMKK